MVYIPSAKFAIHLDYIKNRIFFEKHHILSAGLPL